MSDDSKNLHESQTVVAPVADEATVVGEVPMFDSPAHDQVGKDKATRVMSSAESGLLEEPREDTNRSEILELDEEWIEAASSSYALLDGATVVSNVTLSADDKAGLSASVKKRQQKIASLDEHRQAVARTLRRAGHEREELPLVGSHPDVLERRRALVAHLAERSRGVQQSRLRTLHSEIGLLVKPASREQAWSWVREAQNEAQSDDAALIVAARLAIHERRWLDAAQLCKRVSELHLSKDEQAYWFGLHHQISQSYIAAPQHDLEALRAYAVTQSSALSAWLWVSREVSEAHVGAHASRALGQLEATQQSAELRANVMALQQSVAERGEALDEQKRILERLQRVQPDNTRDDVARMRYAMAKGVQDEVQKHLESVAQKHQVHNNARDQQAWSWRSAQMSLARNDVQQAKRALDKMTTPAAFVARLRCSIRLADVVMQGELLAQWSQVASGASRAYALFDLAELFIKEQNYSQAWDAIQDAIQTQPLAMIAELLTERLIRRSGVNYALDRSKEQSATHQTILLRSAAKRVAYPPQLDQEMRLLLPENESIGQNYLADLLAVDVALGREDVDTAKTLLERQKKVYAGERLAALVVALGDKIFGERSEKERLTLLEEAHRLHPQKTLWLRAMLAVHQEMGVAADDVGLWCWIEEASKTKGVRSSFAWLQASRHLGVEDDEVIRTVERGWHQDLGNLPVLAFLEQAYAKPFQLDKLRQLYETLATELLDADYAQTVRLRAALLLPVYSGETQSILRSVFAAVPSDSILCEWLTEHGDKASLGLRAASFEATGKQGDDRASMAFTLRAGACYEQLAEWTRAAEQYERVLAREADNCHALRGLERCDRALARYSGFTARTFERIKRTENVVERVWYLEYLAEVEEVFRQDQSSALLAWKTLLGEQPDHPKALRALERHAMRYGRDADLVGVTRAWLKQLAFSHDVQAYAMLLERLIKQLAGTAEITLEKAWIELAGQHRGDGWFARKLWGLADQSESVETAVEALSRLCENMIEGFDRASMTVLFAELLERYDSVRAAAALSAAVNGAPTHPVAAEELAWLAYALEHHALSAQAFSLAAQTSKVAARAADLWYRAGLLWQERLGDDDRAVHCYKQAAQTDIAYADVFSRLLTLLRPSGSSYELAELIEMRIEADADVPYLISLYLHLAKVRLELKEPALAKKAYQSALGLDPDSLEGLQGYADLCLEAGEWELAAEQLIRLARLHKEPSYLVPILRNLGHLYDFKLGEPGRAVAAYQRVLVLDSDQLEVLRRLAVIYANTHEDAQRIKILEALVQKDVDPKANLDHRIELAKTWSVLGQLRKAEEVLEQARRVAPLDLDLLRFIASFYQDQGAQSAWSMHLNRAVADFRRAIEVDMTDRAAWLGLLEVLSWQGMHEAAGHAAVSAEVVGIYDMTTSKIVQQHGANHFWPNKAIPAHVVDIIAPQALSSSCRTAFILLGEAMDKLTPFPVGNFRLEKLGPKDATFELYQRRLSAWLATDRLQIQLGLNTPLICAPMATEPPCVLIGNELLHVASLDDCGFMLTRAAILAKFGYSAALRLPIDQLEFVLWSIVHSFDPSLVPPGLDERQLAELAKRIMKHVARKHRDELVRNCVEVVGSPQFRAEELAHAMVEFANRLALLLCGSIKVAADALQRLGQNGAYRESLSQVDETVAFEIRELIAFSISDRYFQALELAHHVKSS